MKTSDTLIITAELSLYPLTEDYNKVVIDYIRALREDDHLEIKTGGMSTMIKGSSAQVMAAVARANERVLGGGTKGVLVAKFLNANAFDDPHID